jgi:hypothetical protein
MMHRGLPAAIAAACAMLPAASIACGVCVDDKVAATYDHTVVSRAIDRRQVVVFAEIRGPGAAEALVARARTATRRVGGIERASVRAAAAPAALSFALDPAVRGPEAALAAIEKAAGPGLRLSLLKVLP